MSDCAQLIETIYNHPSINKLIGNIKPPELQQDLKQEMALALLNTDCDKLLRMSRDENVIGYSLRIIWKMGTLQNGSFYKKFKRQLKKDDIRNYIESLEPKTFLRGFGTANTFINEKMAGTAEDAHESMIFQKYVELKSTRKVAEYFGIPFMHTFQVIKKMKTELKKRIRQEM